MSGGSWDYVFGHIGDVADALKNDTTSGDRRPLNLTEQQIEARHKLGLLIEAVSTALHAVEWVDSDDWSTPADVEAIDRVFLLARAITDPPNHNDGTN